MNFKVAIIFFSFWLHIVALSSQKTYRFGFDDCSFKEAAALIPDISTGGSPQCVCGIDGQSMRLDGVDDFLFLDPSINDIFSKDFTLDFYFWMELQAVETDIMSLRNGCTGLDSLMALKYLPESNELFFEISSGTNNYQTAKQKLNTSNCWHRFTLVKFGLEYDVYFDNILVKEIIARENIVMTKLGKLSFANNDCNVINQANKLRGRIDEVVIKEAATPELEVARSFAFPDRIVNRDVTIFKGDEVPLQVGVSCANQISWQPTASLSDPNILDPIASPEETTTYVVNLQNDGCVSMDSVTIYVADKDKLDCNLLLLPKAFTPNNDGLNDEFGISNTYIIERLEYFEIFDRSGAKIWQTNDIEGKWNGDLNGIPLAGGMYMYKINYVCKGEEKLAINQFTLLK